MSVHIWRLLPALFAVSVLVGCDEHGNRITFDIGPGRNDFSAPLAAEYHLIRTSGVAIQISPLEWDEGTPTIPTKVIECGADDRFIVAKRIDPEDDVETTTFDYWILDTSKPSVYGPLSTVEYEAQRKKLGVPESVLLRDASEYRNR